MARLIDSPTSRRTKICPKFNREVIRSERPKIAVRSLHIGTAAVKAKCATDFSRSRRRSVDMYAIEATDNILSGCPARLIERPPGDYTGGGLNAGLGECLIRLKR